MADQTLEEKKDVAPSQGDLDPGESTGVKKGKTAEELATDALDTLKTEIDDNYKIAKAAYSDWVVEAKEDIAFSNGDQWKAEERQKLEQQGRPVLTFNKIKPIIKLLTGHLLQNSARLQVSPEGGEDQKFSEVMDKLIDFIDEESHLEFNLGYLFAGGEKAGRAWVEFYIDYSEDPIFGQLRALYQGPFKIMPDPRGTEYDLSDRQYCFKIIKKRKAELKELYPKAADKIDQLSLDSEADEIGGSMAVEGDRNNYGNDKTRSQTGISSVSSVPETSETQRQYTVKEYWYVKRVTRCFVYFVDKGDMPRFNSKAEAQAEIDTRKAAWTQGGGADADFKFILRERQVREMHVAIKAGGEVLENGLSPMEPYYRGFPFFQFLADWSPEAEKESERVMGIVRALKDPQREKNKARSQFLHILGTAANSGWVGDDDALTDPQWNELKNFGSTPGITLRKKKGSQLDRIQPVAPDLANQVREKAASDDFKEVSGINSDLLAVDQSSNPSGKAIALRIRQAITILESDFRNFRYTKKLIGQFLFKIVPMLFDVAKIKKVLGETFMQANQITDIDLKTFLILIEDGRYNVRIAEQGNTKTMREETFEDLMNMINAGMQIPFEVMADFMSIPNKSEVLAKVQAFQAQQQAAALAVQAQKSGTSAAKPQPPQG